MNHEVLNADQLSIVYGSGKGDGTGPGTGGGHGDGSGHGDGLGWLRTLGSAFGGLPAPLARQLWRWMGSQMPSAI